MARNRLAKNQSGAAAIEFALILPVMLLFIFGIIEFSLFMFNKQVLTNACREGARVGVVVRNPRNQVNEEQSQHHFGRIGRTATAFVGSFYFAGIQLLDNFYHEASQTVFIQPPFQIARQFECHSSVNFDKFVADEPSPSQFSIREISSSFFCLFYCLEPLNLCKKCQRQSLQPRQWRFCIS